MNLPGYDFTSFWGRSGLLGTLYQKEGEPINLIPASAITPRAGFSPPESWSRSTMPK